ncbi:MAG: hypothetical protein QOD67_2192 [Caballeronia sp.]|nr:hypothetical protein [Caballeronia sp.]
MKADVRSRLEFDPRRRGEQGPAGVFNLGRLLRRAAVYCGVLIGSDQNPARRKTN